MLKLPQDGTRGLIDAVPKCLYARMSITRVRTGFSPDWWLTWAFSPLMLWEYCGRLTAWTLTYWGIIIKFTDDSGGKWILIER